MTSPLSRDRWNTLEPLLDAALELAPERRPAFVNDSCAGDDALRDDLTRLLAEYDCRDPLLDRPAAERFASLLDQEPTRLPAVLIDRYRIERELGHGGMATVYLARDIRHERQVAVKVLRPEVAAALGAERFLAEIRLTARLQHPHILPLHDSGDADGLLFYVMPYVDGESLRCRLDREKQLPIEDAVRIASEVASALEAAHRRGVVHRDIKPENILLRDGTAVVADFGIALALSEVAPRVTRPGLTIGTPQYMSPEQATGDGTLDGRADLYSLGTVLYEMLAGEPPFMGASASAIIAKRLATPAPAVRILRAPIPVSLDAVVARALAREPADRYPTAGEFAEALRESLLPGDPGVASPGREPLEALRTVVAGVRGRRWGAIAFLGLTALTAVAVLAWRGGRGGRVLPPLDQNKIVVVPFEVTGGDSSVNNLAQGIPYLLAPELTGEGGPRAVDAGTAISAWSRVSRGGQSPSERAREVARLLGASKAVFGNVLFASGRLTLAANLANADGGDARPYATVTGPLESLTVLLDSLVRQILVHQAAVPAQTVGALTSEKLSALRAYLDGRAAYRRARSDEAIRDLTRALEIDSTFALAALDLATATTKLLRQGRVCQNSSCRRASVVPGFRDTGLPNDDAIFERAIELAWLSRSKLGSRDLPLLEALRGAHWPQVSAANEVLADLKKAAVAAPDRAETQYFLGLILLYQGFAVGYSDPFAHAEASFRRALELDPAYLPPLARLVDVAAYERHPKKLQDYATLYLSHDSTSATADYVRWREAVGTGDSAKTERIRARFDSLDVTTLQQILTASQMSGVALGDADRAANLIVSRRTDTDGGFYWSHMLALNRGRPHRADTLLRLRAEHDSARLFFSQAFTTYDALFGQGDSAEAERGSHERVRWLMRDTAPEPPTRPNSTMNGDSRTMRQEIANNARREVFQEAIWDWAHARLASAARLTRWLRVHGDSAPADVADMLIATDERRGDAARLRARVDTAASSGCCRDFHHINLELAIAYERAGNDTAALRAVRRGKWRLPTMYLATYLRMEGRLAARVGDRDGAIRAYEHYLALRSDPEPALRADADTVRAALARLQSR
jgi:tetratricopeptide (TPR) repeat protein